MQYTIQYTKSEAIILSSEKGEVMRSKKMEQVADRLAQILSIDKNFRLTKKRK